ncbi:MAG TPA: hypothetical protein VHZ78_08805 [Rhizomicrobium sp.]|jgi:hypothetical protein|nr:hypothetical protein [Rhizomicrobium sp.]
MKRRRSNATAPKPSLALTQIRHRQSLMTSDEVDDELVKTIIQAIEDRGTLQDFDLKRADVLPELITKDRIKRCMVLAEDRVPRLRHMRREAA